MPSEARAQCVAGVHSMRRREFAWRELPASVVVGFVRQPPGTEGPYLA